MSYTLPNDPTNTTFDDRTDKNHAREWLDIMGPNEGRPLGYDLWLFKEPSPSFDGTFQVRAGTWTYPDSFAAAGKRIVGPKLGNKKLIRHVWNQHPGERLTFAGSKFSGFWRGGLFLGAKFDGAEWNDGIWCGTQFDGVWHDGVAIISNPLMAFTPVYQRGLTVMIFTNTPAITDLPGTITSRILKSALNGNQALVVIAGDYIRSALNGEWLGPSKMMDMETSFYALARQALVAIKQPYESRGKMSDLVWDAYQRAKSRLDVLAPEASNIQFMRFIKLFRG